MILSGEVYGVTLSRDVSPTQLCIAKLGEDGAMRKTMPGCLGLGSHACCFSWRDIDVTSVGKVFSAERVGGRRRVFSRSLKLQRGSRKTKMGGGWSLCFWLPVATSEFDVRLSWILKFRAEAGANERRLLYRQPPLNAQGGDDVC